MSPKTHAPRRGRPRSNGTGRLRKVACGDCGCILYGSAGALRVTGLPSCACGGRFAVANLRDLDAIDPAAFDALLASSTESARTAILRELGYVRRNSSEIDLVTRKAPPRRTQQPQCAHTGCSKFRAYGVKFCANHADLESMPF